MEAVSRQRINFPELLLHPDGGFPGVDELWSAVVCGSLDLADLALPCSSGSVERVCPRSVGLATEPIDRCWASHLQAFRRCAAVSSVGGAGLLEYLCRRVPGSSSPSSAGEGAEMAVPRPSSSSSCRYVATENYDFPSVWRSPKSRSSRAPGGSSDGDQAAAARPGSASVFEEDDVPRDLIVIFMFSGVVLYCLVC